MSIKAYRANNRTKMVKASIMDDEALMWQRVFLAKEPQGNAGTLFQYALLTILITLLVVILAVQVGQNLPKEADTPALAGQQGEVLRLKLTTQANFKGQCLQCQRGGV